MMFLNEMSQPDKKKHFIYEAVVAIIAVVAFIARSLYRTGAVDLIDAGLVGLAAAAAAGLLKGVLDWLTRFSWWREHVSSKPWWPLPEEGHVDIYDFIAGMAGGAAVSIPVIIAGAIWKLIAMFI
ncbi:hypothetical protein WCX72_10010 [Sulfurimonas sp. HSL1-6]|uniref:hypothetical protein n=1 Tax=Thiomicrolovo immobilis TaxID=3131935 RepID=UPI0031F7A784